MQGARRYAMMFKTGQYGRLYLSSGDHARGKTFHIYVLPEGVSAIANGQNRPRNKGIVEVYGITGGNPGWTETYGWLHRGKWEQDFADMVETRTAEIDAEDATRAQQRADAASAEDGRVAALLLKYAPKGQPLLHRFLYWQGPRPLMGCVRLATRAGVTSLSGNFFITSCAK